VIIRREHNGNFTIVPNAIFNDRRLSIEAIGLLGYLLSRPPNWTARHGHLRKTLRMGRMRFERAMWELMSAGYVERDKLQPRSQGNQFSAYNYVVLDVPTVQPPGQPPLSGFPLRVSRCRKSDNGNKIRDNKTDSNKTLSKTSPKAQAGLFDGLGEDGLSDFGSAARNAGCVFIFEGSKPFSEWVAFRGEDGMPPIDAAVVEGARRRGVWLPSLYPPDKAPAAPAPVQGPSAGWKESRNRWRVAAAKLNANVRADQETDGDDTATETPAVRR
jgi:hypothetical protein